MGALHQTYNRAEWAECAEWTECTEWTECAKCAERAGLAGRKAAFKATLAAAFVALACALCFVVALPAAAYADFTVYVGYSGGPYYEKARYTDAEMAAMADAKLYEYTTFDAIAMRKGFAYGVRLEQLFANAGVSTSELKRFYFSTEDHYISDDGVEGYGAWTYDYLIGTPRYYFPNLINVLDFEDFTVSDYDEAWSGAVQVPTVIAIKSSFSRVESDQSDAWTDTSYMKSGYRLFYGQSDPLVGEARSYADVLLSTTCIFYGTPEISFTDESGEPAESFEAEVGDTVTISAPTIKAADELIEQYGKYDISWSVSDPGVADFVRDEDGNVIIDEDGNVQLKILGEGDISVTASYGQSPSSEYRTSASLGGKGTGSKGGGEGGGGSSEDPDGGGETPGGGGSDDPVDPSDDPVNPDPSDDPVDPSDDPTPEKDVPISNYDSNQDSSLEEDAEVTTLTTETTTESVDAAATSTASEQTAEEASDAAGAAAAGEEGATAKQAWKISAKANQTAMVDDLLFGSPTIIAIIVFALFVCGFVGRVLITERQKDPYVDERLDQQRRG